MEDYSALLQQYWGVKEFRPLQEEVITSVMAGKDTLVLMPTGGGKSLTFQLPALAKEGICLVITPLIALMKDQVERLRQKGVKALAIHSGLNAHEIDIAFDNAAYGDYKFLYLSPERLATPIFKERVRKMNVSLVAVDEAHCISQWGYDFRPSYLNIAKIRPLLEAGVPFLALTATATPEVANDIMDKLLFAKKNLLRSGFERKNLIYVVRQTEDKLREMLKIISGVKGSGIIYVRERKKTSEIARFLQKESIAADFYHAGLSPELRSLKQDEWQSGKTRIIIATNAFGMGIDKANVRFVIHFDMPDSVEAYFQEAGRAGRDGNRAYAVLLYQESDRLSAEQRLRTEFPPIDEIKRVYQSVCNYLNIPYEAGKGAVYDFNLIDFSRTYKVYSLTAYNALKFLEYEGYLELTDELDNPSRIMFQVNRDDLYKIQVANPDLDRFIKILLRTYTGLFSDYVRIDESFLSKTAKLSPEQVYNQLRRLSQMRILTYIPRKRTPLIIFTEERLDEKNLRISTESYALRKERQTDRIQYLLAYAENTTKCRSQQLLAYFGETDTYRCGYCDVCIARNEVGLSKYEFDLLLEKIKSLLHPNPLSLEQTIDDCAPDTDKALKVIRWLLDNEKVHYNKQGLLQWHKAQKE